MTEKILKIITIVMFAITLVYWVCLCSGEKYPISSTQHQYIREHYLTGPIYCLLLQ